jgi:DNA helicase-2/ATP-dependent DNA helicase PcrA
MSIFPEQYRRDFESKVLATLNPGQMEAVRQIEGPVMVIAGPGTGKTQLLAARIGNILLQTDTDSSEILCLTYTEAGTLAMKERLAKFMGPEGYRIPVYTFHGFCNKVIQENPAIFGGYRELQAISELEKRRLLKQLVDELPSDHLLKRLKGDYYNDIGRLAVLFDAMKLEGFSADQMVEAIDLYLSDLPNRPDFQYKRAPKGFKAGDPNPNSINKETENLEKTRAAATLLPLWQEKLNLAGRYDFSDMLQWVSNAFREHPHLLLNYQERYQYLLVDEYQDTSGLQNDILYQLADYWDRPNLFAVGDDDQAIYRFQGASMANILTFYKKYEPHTVMLTDNYRSTQAILDSADTLISHNTQRLNTVLHLEKQLTAANTDLPSPGAHPLLLEFESSTAEDHWILEKIQALIASGVRPNEIAVLYRNHKHADNLIRLCQRKGVPVSQQRRENILLDPFILGLLEILYYLDGESRNPFGEEWRLIPLLHYRYFNISSLDIARLLHFKQRSTVEMGLPADKKQLHWRELITDPLLVAQAGVHDPDAILRAANLLEEWLKGVREWTLQTLFEKILISGGVVGALLNDPQKRRLLEMVTTLFDYIKNETASDPQLSLEELMIRLTEMYEGNIALPYVHYIGDAEGVPFSTIHSAKGLEWKHVFLLACSNNNWIKKSSGAQYKWPDTLLPGSAVTEDQLEEDERRLFFVGITRASQGLYLSYAKDQKNSRNQKTGSHELASKFMLELLESPYLDWTRPEVSPDDKEDSLIALLETPDVNPGLLDDSWLRRKVQDFVLSVTALNKYLTCPRAFYYENILRVPSARNKYMGFGSAVHLALETLFNRNPNLDGKVDEQLVMIFREAMVRFRSHFTPLEYNLYLDHADKILPLYVKNALDGWRLPKETIIEKNITDVEWQEFPIKGKLDKLEIYPDGLWVIDYKTGNPANARKKLKGPEDETDPGGDYWRQIVFYTMLMRADRQNNHPIKGGVMEFIEPDAKDQLVRVHISVTDEDLAVVTGQIAEAYQGIRSLAFHQGCHDPQCTWCNLIDHHLLPESLTPGGLEDLEDEV